MDGRYLVVRSDDHVVLGLQFTAIQLVEFRGPTRPSRRATGRVVLVLIFPPQHIAEQVGTTRVDEPLQRPEQVVGPVLELLERGLGVRPGHHRGDLLGERQNRLRGRCIHALHPSYTNIQIAAALVISVRTASVHVSNILHNLDATNRLEAAAIAHRLGPAARRVTCPYALRGCRRLNHNDATRRQHRAIRFRD
jgi:hypothetical protein